MHLATHRQQFHTLNKDSKKAHLRLASVRLRKLWYVCAQKIKDEGVLPLVTFKRLKNNARVDPAAVSSLPDDSLPSRPAPAFNLLLSGSLSLNIDPSLRTSSRKFRAFLKIRELYMKRFSESSISIEKQQSAAPLAYRVRSLSVLTGLSSDVLRQAIRENRLVARKCGNALLILHTDAVNWLESLPTVNGNGKNVDAANIDRLLT